MLWFRVAAVVFLVLTALLAFSIGMSAFVMCVSPSSDRSMDSDPYYNGTLFFYILVIFEETCMTLAAAFGFIVAFRVWKNNLQLDHKLRHLFTLWLASLSFSTFAGFLLGLMGLVRYRETQEEIMSLYEIFSKYSQDIKFVGSFERIQREHSCCGVNGPEDWYSAQFKSSGVSSMASMGMEMNYMGIGSPSTGKCHLTPPTFPMGCGKTLREIIYYTQAVYSSLIIVQTVFAITAAAFSWYCFFYWIEKEVIIIPEDEVSNLVVVEPESSVSTMYSVNGSGSIPSSWSGSSYSSNGSSYTQYVRPGSKSHYGQLGDPSARQVSGNRFAYSGYAGSRSYYPNSRRHADIGNNVMGLGGSAIPIGGPHVAYHYPDRSDAGQSINHNHNVAQDYSYSYQGDPSSYTYYRGSGGTGFTGVSASNARPTSQFYGSRMTSRGNDYSQAPNYGVHHGHYLGSMNPEERTPSYRDDYQQYQHETNHLNQIESRHVNHSRPSHHHHEHVHKKHSFNHMLHKQEKALGGKVLGEMHIDHSRDPDPLNAQIDTAKGARGHRAHHATVFLVKNKKQKKSKTILGAPDKGYGQTGHLAEDIIDMSGGAAAVKSLVDNIKLPVEHNPHLGKEQYVNKMHLARKKDKLGHPDPDKPGHGAVHRRGDRILAPEIDGSQAQSLMDVLLHSPKPKEPSEHAIRPHAIVKHDTHHHRPHNNHHHPDNHHRQNYSPSTELLFKNPYSTE